MMNVTVNAKRNEIVITKDFAKKASKYGTEEYNTLKEVKNDFPNFKVVTRANSRKSDSYKGLTYDYMKKYIEAHDDNEQTIMTAFLDLIGESEAAKDAMAEPLSYGEIKAWFFKQFPQIEKFHKNREALLAA